MDKIELSDIQGNVKLADVKLSSLSADAVVGIFNQTISCVNDLAAHHNEISCVATGAGSHAEGQETSATCTASHSEGYQTMVYPYEIMG